MARRLKGKAGHQSLKNALQRHQNHEKLKQVHRRNEQHKQRKAKPNSQVRKNQELQRLNDTKFIPFKQHETLLLIGEGDFSFTRSLIEQKYLMPENLIATSYDASPSELQLKYPHSFKENYDFLVKHGVKIIFKIDATNLIRTFNLSKRTPWTKLLGPSWKNKALKNIIFNFPHTGKGVKDQERNIVDHQELIFGFFRSCKELFGLVNAPVLEARSKYNQGYSQSQDEYDLTPEGYGKILLSVFAGEPYDSWMIKSIAKDNNLSVQRSHKFQWEHYPQYHHRRTNSEQETTTPAAEREARMYIFEKYTRPKNKPKVTQDDE